jgi:predicted dehydrogenase
VIGAGQIAKEHLACLRDLPLVDVAAVCDLSSATAECAAEAFQIPRWYTDHRACLEQVRPDVVHVTTPPTSHFRIAMDAIDAGCHVIVEKPAAASFDEVDALAKQAAAQRRAFVEDYNYLFNRGPREILDWIRSGEFGSVVHVDVMICLNILGPSGFADPNAPHPCQALPGGAISDFLPHLASLAHLFIGAHQEAHAVWTKRQPSILKYDEFRAIVEGERGTASLAFSSSAQPDAFWLRVFGERMQATTNLFETRLTVQRTGGGAKPIQALINGLQEGKAVRRAAIGTLARKFRGGPGAYEGLHELLGRTYHALAAGSPLPISADHVLAVNRLVAALNPRLPS